MYARTGMRARCKLGFVVWFLLQLGLDHRLFRHDF